jgi:hypothetical protein
MPFEYQDVEHTRSNRGDLLRAFRVQCRVTFSQIACRTGYRIRDISGFENGRLIITNEDVISFIEALGLSPTETFLLFNASPKIHRKMEKDLLYVCYKNDLKGWT